MSLRPAQAASSLLATLLLLAAACAPPAGNNGGNQRATSLPATQSTATASAVGSEAALLPSSQLQLAYRLVLQRFVDRVNHTLLLDAAHESARQALLEDKALPLDTSIVDLVPNATDSPDHDWLTFARSYDALIHKYPDWATSVRLDHRVLDRMMESLADQHTVFIPPDQYWKRQQTEYSGIGVRLALPTEGQPPRIAEVFPRTPAAQAGLQAGDRIISVEGQAITGLSLSRVADLIRGPEGSVVNLELERYGQSTPLRVSITRRAVEIPMVNAEMVGQVGYVRILGFSEPVPRLVAAALGQLKQLGAQGWVLDVRGNSGGRLSAVQAVAGMFVDGKPIGIEINRTRERTPLVAQGPRLVSEAPLAVLIDSETTSGAEIFAAALREHLRATLVGERSAGNVAVAEEHVLADGSAIQLTVRRFLSPSGGQLDRVGVEPDVGVELSDGDLSTGQDPQLARAVQMLQDQAG